MVVEVANAGIAWTEPKDLSLDALVASSPGTLTVSSNHFPGGEFFTYTLNPGANVAFADGSVRFLPGGLLASDEFPELLTVGGFREEYLDADWSFAGRRIHWPNCTAFAVWLASTCWLFVRAARSRKKAAPSAQPSSMATGSPQSGGE
jgi:prepilin-type processing-associated H-X9-DG protein